MGLGRRAPETQGGRSPTGVSGWGQRDDQILGKLGEAAVKKLVLEMCVSHEHRGRLEAGTDGLVELRDPSNHTPLGKLLGIQVKSTAAGVRVSTWTRRSPNRESVRISPKLSMSG